MTKKHEVSHVTVSLNPGEAVVVMEKKYWDHIAEFSKIMSDDSFNSEDKSNWLSYVTTIQTWVKDTHFDPNLVLEIDDDDDWG